MSLSLVKAYLSWGALVAIMWGFIPSVSEFTDWEDPRCAITKSWRLEDYCLGY